MDQSDLLGPHLTYSGRIRQPERVGLSSEAGGDTLRKLNACLSGHEVDTTRSQMITQRSMVIEPGRVPWLGQGNFQIR